MTIQRGITKRAFLKACFSGVAALSYKAGGAETEGSRFRPPSVPLIVTDPYFSIWSNSELLNDAATEHWTGRPHRLTSLIRIDGQCYRLMGNEPKSIPALTQVSVTVHPTRSVYVFADAGVIVRLTFMTAALPDDLMILSRPLGYMTWSVRSNDGRQHAASVYCDASTEIVVNEPSQRVSWSNDSTNDLAILSAGCVEQNVLNPKGDNVRIDWGRLYLATERKNGIAATIASSPHAWRDFETTGTLSSTPKADAPRAVSDNAPSLVLALDLGSVGSEAEARTVMLAYDEVFAIQFFEENLHPFWRKNGAGPIDLLTQAATEYPALNKRCEAFDQELTDDARKLGGEKYADICALAYRQCMAGNGIAADTKGQPLLLPKENTSNGCIGTVDVIYPMAPQFLLFGPSLSKSMLVSNLEYGSSKRWHFPFAPHDLGTYPQANGQVYGGGEKTEENQMPVEETGNMLILLAAVAQMEDSAEFAARYWPTIHKWADYLKAEGFDPKNQLCTDDFAGHLAHNVNLSAKAIIGLGAYAILCRLKGDSKRADEHLQLAKTYAARWIQQANGGDHFGLTFDNAANTWSQKYNLVWDRILGLNLFPDEVFRKEMNFYKQHLTRCGLPLDSRKLWTKLDWTLWTATLTNSQTDFETLVGVVWNFLNTTPDRVPMSDFYWAQDGKDAGMHARPVVGGVFLRFLYDSMVWRKWASRDRTRASDWADFPSTAFPVA